jgi:hypothetical protein
MVQIKWEAPWIPFFWWKKPSWFIISSNLWGIVESEVMEFDIMYYSIITALTDLERDWVAIFLTTYWKNKRVKEWNKVKFYFIMDWEPWYDNDEYEFVFEDTFESLKKAIKSFEKEGKQYLDYI